MKKIKILIVILILIILLSATAFSMYKFAVLNPFASCRGMLEIFFTDKEYVIVQKWPHRVMFLKPEGNYLEKYMNDRGYTLYDQLGSMFTYANGDKRETFVRTHANEYYISIVWTNQH